MTLSTKIIGTGRIWTISFHHKYFSCIFVRFQPLKLLDCRCDNFFFPSSFIFVFIFIFLFLTKMSILHFAVEFYSQWTKKNCESERTLNGRRTKETERKSKKKKNHSFYPFLFCCQQTKCERRLSTNSSTRLLYDFLLLLFSRYFCSFSFDQSPTVREWKK